MERDETDWRLITAHLAGETTPEQELELQRWLEEDPSRREMLRLMRDAWRGSPSATREHPVDAGWARVQARLWPERGRDDREPALDSPEPQRDAAPPVPPQDLSQPAASPLRWAAGLRRAAALILLLLPAALLALLYGGGAPPADSFATVVVPRGQQTEVRLADGSRVIIGPESTLRYPRRFDGAERELHLDGMAYFEVVHDPARSFTVYAMGAATRVLGTAFVVQAYAAEGRVRVAVTEGRVALRAQTDPADAAVPVGSGEVGEVGADGTVEAIRPATLDAYVGWTQGRLSVSDQPLGQAVELIGRWYDVEIVVDDPVLAARRITTTLDRESLANALSLIALSVDARYTQRGDTVFFHRDAR